MKLTTHLGLDVIYYRRNTCRSTPSKSMAISCKGHNRANETCKKAASPPPLIKKGRLKVLGTNGKLSIYIPKEMEANGLLEYLPRGRGNDALSVLLPTSVNEPFEIQFVVSLIKFLFRCLYSTSIDI